jgi:nicotinate-nucleotide adenylyltransferase
MTRIGIFGGQFDPPHAGHLAVVRAARDQLGLDRVLVIPSPRPPHRPPAQTPADVRLQLAEAAFAGEPGVEVSRLELDRDGPSYTADTLEALTAPDRELYLILGADQLAALPTWHRPADVSRLARLVVAARPGAPAPGGVVELAMAPNDVSSSDLRRRIAAGEDVAGLVPAGVAAAIERRGLYRRGAVLG